MDNGGRYDDSQLMKMLEMLSPQERKKAIKAAFRKMGMKVRDIARSNLRLSMPGANKNVEKGIRVVVYRNKLGFRVTVGTKKSRVNYKGATGKALTEAKKKEREKIVPLWAEGGTENRVTATSGQRFGIRWKSRGRGHRTGRMKPYLFMEKTKGEALEQTGDTAEKEIIEQIFKVAVKYGGQVD